MTGKGAANFIRWKFNTDLQVPARLASVILTYPDFDHYGGMLNLLSGDLQDGRAPFEIEVDRFYHNGIGCFNANDELGQYLRGTVQTAILQNF